MLISKYVNAQWNITGEGHSSDLKWKAASRYCYNNHLDADHAGLLVDCY